VSQKCGRPVSRTREWEKGDGRGRGIVGGQDGGSQIPGDPQVVVSGMASPPGLVGWFLHSSEAVSGLQLNDMNSTEERSGGKKGEEKGHGK